MIDELKQMLETFLNENSSLEYIKSIQTYLQDSTLRQDPQIERLFTAISDYLPSSIDRGMGSYNESGLRKVVKEALEHIEVTYKTDTA